MEEAVLEGIRKEEADEQWNKYHEAEREKPPTERQLVHIAELARSIGLRINTSTIETKEKAFRMIWVLKLLKRRMK